METPMMGAPVCLWMKAGRGDMDMRRPKKGVIDPERPARWSAKIPSTPWLRTHLMGP